MGGSMSEEFEGDLSGAVFWRADLSGARFRDVNLTDVKISHVRDYLATVAPADLTRTVEVIENGTNTLQECLCTVFEEEFWHLRYAHRDLGLLDAVSGKPT
jgi:hypothetical protein